MTNGICTLANDSIFDQLVALLNSIEAIMGKDFPVCIYPYDDRLDKVKAELVNRPQVELYQDFQSIQEWDQFARDAWDTHPNARERWAKAGSDGYHRFGTHRRYGAFDAPFDRFIYMDGDTLLMDDISFIFNLLDQYDCIVYDFQHKDLTHVYEVSSPKLTQVFNENRLKNEIFCSGFYASKKGLFPPSQRQFLVEQLKTGEAEIVYPMSVDQALLNYMMMKSGYKIYNLALNLPSEKRTGNSVTSSHFENKNNIMYDKGVRLTYLHYIGVSSKLFTKLCTGENLDFPYRDIFLYYRYLHEPEKMPKFIDKPQPYNPPPTIADKVLRKLGFKK
jgi:hypothetical protein